MLCWVNLMMCLRLLGFHQNVRWSMQLILSMRMHNLLNHVFIVCLRMNLLSVVDSWMLCLKRGGLDRHVHHTVIQYYLCVRKQVTYACAWIIGCSTVKQSWTDIPFHALTNCWTI